MAFTIFSMALSCAITSCFRLSAMLTSRALSLSCIRWTGMPVIIETTSATLSASTSTRLLSSPRSHFRCAACSSCSNAACLSRKLAASSKFWFFTASRFFRSASSNCFFSSIISGGTWAFCRCTRAPTSSIASMALSGKKRSVMYRSVSLTHDVMASSVYETW